MNHRRTLGLRALAAMSLAFAFVAAGCSAGNGNGTGDAHGDGGVRCDGSHCPLDGSVIPDAGQSTDLLSIAITPANPTLRVTAATPAPTQAFTLVGTQRDGRTRPLTTGVNWYLTDASLGSISVTGVFTSNGAGGSTTLRAAYGTLAPVTTTVTVLVSTEIRGPGVTDALVAGFTVATLAGDNATSSPTVDYPLPAAVMPSNVFPPRVMWTARTAEAPTDVVRVLLSRDHASVTYYGLGSPLGWDIDPTAWGEFARSDIGLPITLTVSVLSGTTLRTSAPRTFKTISAVLGGSVYYWSPPAGALARIDVTTAAHVSFLPNPGDSCIGCHNVTRDGHRLMGFLNNVGNLIQFDLTRDLTGSPAANLGSQPYSPRQCGTFNPDGSRYLMGDCGVDVSLGTAGNAFRLVDTATMLPTSIAAGAAGTGFDPDWSPDGHHIAYTDVNNTVMVEPVTGPDVFGAPVPIRTGTNNTGEINWHPTWSPDNAWLAFQLGSLRRTGNGATGEIYLIAPTGGNAVHLANASAGADGTAYRPVFSPFNSGGDFWLLFASTRSYGTAAGGGVEGQKQIWVTAIHNHPDGVNDPSEAPYWLAGQEPNTALSPYWVPPPCRSNGTDCTSGNDCCSGQCGDPDSTGARACVPATNQCRMLGQTCTQDSDCCGGLVCNPMGHLCDVSLPG